MRGRGDDGAPNPYTPNPLTGWQIFLFIVVLLAVLVAGQGIITWRFW